IHAGERLADDGLDPARVHAGAIEKQVVGHGEVAHQGLRLTCSRLLQRKYGRGMALAEGGSWRGRRGIRSNSRPRPGVRRLAAKTPPLAGLPRIVAPTRFGVGSGLGCRRSGPRRNGRRRGFGRTARSPDHPARKIVLRTAAPGGAPRGAAGPVILGQRASSPERGCKDMLLRLTRLIPRSCAVRVALAAAAMAGLTAAGWAAEPQPWQMNLQPPATPVMEQLAAFHNGLWPPGLLVITFLITIFVL